MTLTFESKRLAFRPLHPDDLDLLVAQWGDPDVVRYISGKTYSRQELSDEMHLVTRRCAGGCIGIWSLTEQTTGEKIGTGVLLPMPVELDDTDWDLVVGDQIPDAEIEVGYILKKSAWGKGYATEACKRLLQFAFEETPLQEVVANIAHGNEASRGVLVKSGLTEQGLIRAYGEVSPGFKITRSDWLSLTSV